MQREATGTARWQRWWPLLLLFVLSSSRWMLEESVPRAASTALTEGIGCAAAALIAAAVAWAPRRPRLSLRLALECALAGALIITGPLLLLLAPQGTVTITSLTMALALVPVVIAVAASAFGRVDTASLPGRLWPGIAAVTGLLLLLPEPSLVSRRGDILLALAPIMTGVGASWLRSRKGDIAWRGTSALTGAAVLFLVAALTPAQRGSSVSVLPVAVDVALALLAVFSLLRIGAVRWSAQFALVPLVVVLESLYLVGLRLDTRLAFGILLLILATTFLLLPPKPEETSDLNLYVLGGTQPDNEA